MNDWHTYNNNKPTSLYTRFLKQKLNRKFLKMILYGSLFFLAMFLLISKFIAKNDQDLDVKSSDVALNYEFNPKLPYDNSKFKYYNSVYPLSLPVVNKKHGTITYKLLAIADLDTNSKLIKSDTKYSSYLLKGSLTLSEDHKRAEIEFESNAKEINSQYSYGDRGMELSDLVVFNGKLYSCDDRTGIVYEINLNTNQAVPWVILPDGDGNAGKGFKCEWMTVKDKHLYVGGLGKEWTTTKGVLVNDYPQWIKIVGPLGDVTHANWSSNYNKIRTKLGYSFPGYMIFESCCWDDINEKWYWLPRRASNESYDEVLDEKRATNLLIWADEPINAINALRIGNIIPTRGYSSFKFVPNTNNQLIIALKSEENESRTRSFVNLFDIYGNVLLDDILLSDHLKYEGIEFI